ncbi:mannosyl-oligosaccharide alpha-1,2-mannosidase [Gryganskiella cystojenkinii]|nr:mannosyl-oligosaccharide alpha-1,2-mannosidase [Gryganskiella cystojenkinii]
MFKRGDTKGSGIPFHDDNKYAKQPMGIHSKSRLRLRKRHAVLALCVFAATYMVLKSPSSSISLPSSTSSSDSTYENINLHNNRNNGAHKVVPELKKAGPPKGQAEEHKIIVAVPQNPNNKQKTDETAAGSAGGLEEKSAGSATNNNAKSNPVDDAAAAAAAKKAADKKKKKKKAPPTLFEFDGIDTPRKGSNDDNKNKGANSNSNNKKPSKPKALSSPPPSKLVEFVPNPIKVKPQHVWREEHNWSDDADSSNRSNGGASTTSEDSVIDASSPSLSDPDDNDEHDAVDVDLNTDNSPPASGRNRLPNMDTEDSGANSDGARPPLRSKAGSGNNSPLWEERKNKVKAAFLHSWNAYRRDAWGKDEYHPVSKYGTNMISKGQGFTIVDSLDTILLMGLDKEFEEARAWVRDELDFDQNGEVNLFETTIRVLGGLLSAYDQSGKDPIFLRKAVDLADRLMGAFETTSGIPYASVHLGDKRGVPGHERGISSTAEVATLQLEFKYLSFLTNNDKYWKAAENVILKMKDLDTLDGLVPIFINPYTGNFHGEEIRLGSRGDSYYEYLIKQYLQTGKKESVYKDMYEHAIGGVKKHLLGRTIPHNFLFIGEINRHEPKNLSPKMDHLVCFLGGTMALASTEGHSLDASTFPRSRLDRVQEEEFKMGEELTESCYEMYRQTETGLAPEIVYWVEKEEQVRGRSLLQHSPGSDFIINDRDGHNWLRPETVESLFYMWRLTGDDKYRHWGWNIFEAIEKYSKVSTGGYSSIHDIRRADNIRFSDKMETFFLAETLKYFYLLFGSTDVLPLDKYVFNTEAHPLPVFTPPERFLTRTAPLSKKLPAHLDEQPDEDEGVNSPEEILIAEDNEDDEVVGADDSFLLENSKEITNHEQDEQEDNSGSSDSSPDVAEPGSSSDEVDQALEDIAVDGGEDEVEVDFEENTPGSEQEEAEEEEEGEDAESEEEEEEKEDGEEGEDGQEDLDEREGAGESEEETQQNEKVGHVHDLL